MVPPLTPEPEPEPEPEVAPSPAESAAPLSPDAVSQDAVSAEDLAAADPASPDADELAEETEHTGSRPESRVPPESTQEPKARNEHLLGDDSELARNKPSGDSATGEESPSPEALDITQLDDLLSEEEIEGDFETIETVVHGVAPTPDSEPEPEKPQEPKQPKQAKQDKQKAVPSIAIPKLTLRMPQLAWGRLILGVVYGTMTLLNRPLQKLPEGVRRTVGYAGLITLFNAFALMIYAAVS